MSTAKEDVRQLLDQLPDDASLDDIQYQIYVRQKIQRGLEDIEAGRVVSQEQVEQQIEQWFEK
jgi:predicted transcriptional regulator